jgi:hypothetical protein
MNGPSTDQVGGPLPREEVVYAGIAGVTLLNWEVCHLLNHEVLTELSFMMTPFIAS